MGRLSLLALWLAGCAYTPPGGTDDPATPGDDTAGVDAALAIDAGIDAPPDVDAPPATPQTTDHVATSDVWIDALRVTTNHSADAFLIADGDNEAAVLLGFDLNLPAATVIQSVELHIWTANDPGAQVQVFPLLESWSETQATWNDRANGAAWSSQGAKPASCGATAIGSFTPSATNTEYTVTLDPATVAGWVADPATNRGLVIHTTNSDGPRFVSREGQQDRRPLLRITHVP